mgnify:CR=1 FL=1
MSVNVDLLDRTLAHIEANPEEWEQTAYRCDTGMCFAGWACQLAGGRWLTPPCDHWGDVLVAEPADDQERVRSFDGVHGTVVLKRATRLLGLDFDIARDLFDVGNTLDDLRRIVADIKAGAT